MKRFSDRAGHTTLAELNVTPMLDLAFVLLIIFIITTPLIEGSIEINLPTATASKEATDPNEVKTVEVARDGGIYFGGRRVTIEALVAQLTALHRQNASLAVVIRADRDLHYQQLVDVFDALQRAQITRLGLMHLDEHETATH